MSGNDEHAPATRPACKAGQRQSICPPSSIGIWLLRRAWASDVHCVSTNRTEGQERLNCATSEKMQNRRTPAASAGTDLWRSARLTEVRREVNLILRRAIEAEEERGTISLLLLQDFEDWLATEGRRSSRSLRSSTRSPRIVKSYVKVVGRFLYATDFTSESKSYSRLGFGV